MFRALALTLLAAAPAAGAADFCAATAEALQQHLDSASANAQPDLVRIAAGTYVAPENGFIYNAQAITEPHALVLEGGWTGNGNDPCGTPPVGDPLLTVLDGGGPERIMWMRLSTTSQLTVRWLSFENGGDGGLQIDAPFTAEFTGEVVVENNAFIGNTGIAGGGLSANLQPFGTGALLRVAGNLFVDNHATDDSGAARIWGVASPPGTTAARLHVIGNTVLWNTTAATGEVARGGLEIAGSDLVDRVVANNLLWDNASADLALFSASGWVLLHNDVQDTIGFEAAVDVGNLSVDPGLQSCAGCAPWALAEDSPLVDAGAHPLSADLWTLPTQDLAGRARVAGMAVDIGALELAVAVFADGFE